MTGIDPFLPLAFAVAAAFTRGQVMSSEMPERL